MKKIILFTWGLFLNCHMFSQYVHCDTTSHTIKIPANEIVLSFYRKIISTENLCVLKWAPNTNCMLFTYSKSHFGLLGKLANRQKETTYIIPIADTSFVPTLIKTYFLMQHDSAFINSGTSIRFNHNDFVAKGMYGVDFSCSEEITLNRTSSRFINVGCFFLAIRQFTQ
jgi:hypothetical protein